MTPLSLAPADEPLTVIDVRAWQRLRRRRTDPGLAPGAVIEIVKGFGHSPPILAVGGSRLALGRGASHVVLVEPERDGK